MLSRENLLWRSSVPPPYPSFCPTTRLGELVRGSFSTKLTTGRVPHRWLVSRPTAPNLAPVNSSESTQKSPGADIGCQISHKWIHLSPLLLLFPPQQNMIILRQKKTDEQLRATGHGESRLPNQEQTRTNRGKFQGKFFSIRSPLESRVVLWKDLSFAGGAELNVRSQFQRLKHRWFQWNGAGLAWNPPQLLILHRRTAFLFPINSAFATIYFEQMQDLLI